MSWPKREGQMKQKVKMIIDVVIIILLPVLMAEALTGQELHEWFGAGIALSLYFTIS